jgi:hypothetical protein
MNPGLNRISEPGLIRLIMLYPGFSYERRFQKISSKQGRNMEKSFILCEIHSPGLWTG